MKRYSFFHKLFTSYGFIILILTGLIYYFSFQVTYAHHIDLLKSQLHNQANLLKSQFKEPLLNENIAEIDSIVKVAGKDIATRITLISKTGKVIADSEKEISLMDDHSTRPEIITASTEDLGYSIRYSQTINNDMLYLAIPIKDSQGSVRYFIRTSFWMKDINQLVSSLKSDFFSSILYMLIFALLLSLFFTKMLSEPIRILADFAKKLPKEEFRTRLNLNNNTELGELANSFNLMANEVQTSFNSLEKEKEELNGIINNIRESLLVISSSGQVQLANKSFKERFEQPVAKGKYYWEIIHNNSFNDLIKKHQESHEFISSELKIDASYFKVSISYLEKKKETICLFHDITQRKLLEQTKKDFVSNVSHELRTPLTSIKGFAETLEYEEEDPIKKRHMEIIIRNSDRLIAMVQDLSMLSNLEDEKSQVVFADYQLDAILTNVERLFSQRLSEQEIQLNVVCPSQCTFHMDAFKIEQIFINLIENALKYSEAHEIKINVAKASEKIHISVSDNGRGIAKEHLNRLFERFYVADKARSRKKGGTGLGLSIVKHIVQLHGGKIDVDSVLGVGTTFKIELPLTQENVE